MRTLPTQEETPLKEKKERKVFASEDMMKEYQDSQIPMLGISLLRNKHYTIHQKEFRSKALGSELETSSLKDYHE